MNIQTARHCISASVITLVLCGMCVGGVSGADIWDGTTVDTTWAGSGTADNPYLITSAAELKGLANQVNNGNTYSGKYFKLTTDLDMAGKIWRPIGTSETNPFKGTFDAQWHKISNYKAYDDNKVCGLFGFVSGTIRNLIVSEVNLDIDQGNVDSGSIVGYLLSGGRVEQCTVLGSVTLVGNNSGTLGGMIGHMEEGAVLEGWSVEDIFIPDVKNWGVVVGNMPSLGESDGNLEDQRVAYYIKIYEVTLIGEYPYELESSVLRSTLTLYSTAGSSVRAVYTVEDGYYLDESRSTLSGVIPSDNTQLTLSVYLKQITYRITLPDSLEISEDSQSGSMSISATRLWIPADSSVRVTVSSEHNLNLAYATDTRILLPYTLKVGGVSLQNGGVVKSFTTADSAAANLLAMVTDSPIYSGSYEDRLTFTLQYFEN